MDSRTLKALNEDLRLVLKSQPGLRCKMLNDIPSSIEGTYEVRDDQGVLQGAFDIRVQIPVGYPYRFPALWETANKIERGLERHVFPDGGVCEEIDRLEKIIAAHGITLNEYFSRYVHRFFCWQLIYEEEGNGNLKEWSHNEDGILQFYKEFLGIHSDSVILDCLQLIASNRVPGRNDRCPCGSKKKAKWCHVKQFEDLKCIGREQLLKDLELFRLQVQKAA